MPAASRSTARTTSSTSTRPTRPTRPRRRPRRSRASSISSTWSPSSARRCRPSPSTQVVANREKVIEVSAPRRRGPPSSEHPRRSTSSSRYARRRPSRPACSTPGLLKTFPGMKTAVILATDEAAGHASAEICGADQKELGLDVQTIYFPTDMTDPSSLITRLRDNPPDLVTVTGAAQPAMNGTLDKLNEAKIGKVLFEQLQLPGRAARSRRATRRSRASRCRRPARYADAGVRLIPRPVARRSPARRPTACRSGR